MNNSDLNILSSLIDLATILGKQTDFQETLRLITQKAKALVKCDYSLIMMVNPVTRQTVKTLFAEGKELRDKKYHFIHTNITGWVIQNNLPFLTADIQKDKRFQNKLFQDTELKSAICVPFRIEAEIIGTMLVINKSKHQKFDQEDLNVLERLADISSPYLRNVRKIEEIFNTPLPKQTLLKKYESFGLLGKSKRFVELLQSVEAAGRCTVRVLLEGESGTGKELVARAIHKQSLRSRKKFHALDCSTIPSSLIESELFGHVKGAFTGATSAHKGILEEADGGTLFMDEINNLPVDMQSKFLRFLQEGEIRPIGSNQIRKVDLRIIAASSVSLMEHVNKQQFREDLFYRLNVYPISLPSLYERREDIPLLANHFVRKFSKEQNKEAALLHGQLTDFISRRDWRGNIRELENFVERLVTLAPVNMRILEPAILPAEFQKEFSKVKIAGKARSEHRPLSESLAHYEQKIIHDALVDCKWNQSEAARLLKISEHAIRYKMNKLGIKRIK